MVGWACNPSAETAEIVGSLGLSDWLIQTNQRVPKGDLAAKERGSLSEDNT